MNRRLSNLNSDEVDKNDIYSNSALKYSCSNSNYLIVIDIKLDLSESQRKNDIKIIKKRITKQKEDQTLMLKEINLK